MRDSLSLNFPIKHGIITNWDNMEKIWHHIFCDLHATPEEHHVLLTDSPLNPITNREKMSEIMFETFHVSNMYIGMQAALALHASDRSTGVVLESGDGVTHIVPIHNGVTLRDAIVQIDVTGQDLSLGLLNWLIQDNILRWAPQYVSQLIVSDIKETLCCTALDYDDEMNHLYDSYCQVDKKTFDKFKNGISPAGTFFSLLPGELCDMVYRFASSKQTSKADTFYTVPEELYFDTPEGEIFHSSITVGHDIIRLPECLFQPSFLGMESAGVHESIYKSIHKCNVDIQQDLYSNILLSGGNTMFPRLSGISTVPFIGWCFVFERMH